MNIEVDYEVLLSRLDRKTHAFEPGDADEGLRTAACGAKVLGLALENNGEPVPGCFDCALKLGMQVEQKIMKRDQETWERIDAEAAKAAAARLTALITVRRLSR